MMKPVEVLAEFFLLDQRPTFGDHTWFWAERCVGNPHGDTVRRSTYPLSCISLPTLTYVSHMPDTQGLFHEGLTQEHAKLGERKPI